MLEEKRISPRIEFHLEVVIKGYHGVKKTSNFSTVGLFIEIENPSRFKQGQILELITRLPEEKKVMKIKARVAHITERGIGVKFMDLSGPDLDAIESTFRIFRATMPLNET